VPTFVTDAEVIVSSTGATTTKTTGTFNASAGAFLVAGAAMQHGGSPPAPLTISDNQGGALTWTKQAERQVDSSTRYCVLWTAPVGGAITGGTVTFTKGSTTTVWWGGFVMVWTGVASVGVTGANSAHSGSSSLSLTTLQANSALVAINVDNVVFQDPYNWNTNVGAFTKTYSDVSSFTWSVTAGYHADSGATGAKSLGVSDPSSQDWSMVGLELRDAGGGGGGPAPRKRWGSVGI